MISHLIFREVVGGRDGFLGERRMICDYFFNLWGHAGIYPEKNATKLMRMTPGTSWRLPGGEHIAVGVLLEDHSRLERRVTHGRQQRQEPDGSTPTQRVPRAAARQDY